MAFLSSLSRLFQLVFILYTFIALVFTTHFIVFSPLANLALSSPGTRSEGSAPWSSRVVPQVHRIHAGASASSATFNSDSESEYDSNLHDDTSELTDEPWLLRSSPSSAPLRFPLSSPSASLLNHLNIAHANSTPISQETFLSKAFAHALHPTKIIPYYYRAKGVIDEDDVTITTLVTSNRFKVFKQLVERYKGEAICRMPGIRVHGSQH